MFIKSDGILQRRVWRSILNLGAVFLVFAATFVIRAQRSSESVWKEYTIIRAESSRTVSGGLLENVRFEAQRKDGSWVGGMLEDATGRKGGVRSVLLRPLLQRVTVDQINGLKTTVFLPNRAVSSPPLSDRLCGFSQISPAMKPVNKGTEEVLGFRTVIIQTEEGPYLHTAWRAPDLDCATIKLTEDRKDDGGQVTGHFELLASQIIVGPPDARLFNVPAEYKEVPPSAMDAAARKGSPVSANMAQLLHERDLKYYENHQNRGR